MKTNKPIKSIARLAFIIPAVAAFLISLSSCKKSIDGEQTFREESNYKDDSGSVSAVTINVKTVGAVGDGVTDDTWAFNEAIDQVHAAGGGTVYVPVGKYVIDADVSINMKSGVTLNMVDSTRVLRAKQRPDPLGRYNIISIIKTSNSKVIGGKINGRRNLYTNPADTTGEHGMGIAIFQSWNARVIGTVIVDCWGDGIVVGASNHFNAPGPSKNCVIENVISRNNRRQGLSILEVDSLIVRNSAFIYTNGTDPQCGIDIEPNLGTAQRVHILDCEIANNAKNGIEMNAKPTTTAVIKDIVVRGNYIHDNNYSGYVQYVDNVKFNYNTMTNNAKINNKVYRFEAHNSNFEPNTYE